jgi:hypothetical protein
MELMLIVHECVNTDITVGDGFSTHTYVDEGPEESNHQ